MVTKNPGTSLSEYKPKAPAYRPGWRPPVVPSAEAAERLLRCLLWCSAEDVALSLLAEGKAVLPPQDDPDWPKAVGLLFEDGCREEELRRRREMLYSLTVQRINALEHLGRLALLRALQEVRAEGLYTLERPGWKGVTGWALAIRDGYSTGTGFWWVLGKIVDHVFPFIEKFLPHYDQERFFELAYLYRVGVVVPQLSRLIEMDEGRGDPGIVQRVEELLNEAHSSSKQDLQDRHQSHRRDKAPAWSEQIRGGGLWLHIRVEDEDHADVLLRRLGKSVDFRGNCVEGAV